MGYLETLNKAAVQTAQYNLIALLKPKISIDGNMWSVVWGDNPQDGVCGFGKSPHLAVLDFNQNWKKELKAHEKI